MTTFFSQSAIRFAILFALCFASVRAGQGQEYDSFSPNRSQRIRLFRVAPGFLSDPVDVNEDHLGLPGVMSMGGSNPSSPSSPPPPASSDGSHWIQFGAGYDNPFVDMRLPGDPGGIGFYRVNSQVELFDSPTTSCTFGVQAVAPAGIQYAGVPNGPTVLCPAFSVFHALGENTAIQGFVSKNMLVRGADNSSFLQQNLQYGMAVQRPLTANGPESLRKVFVSVGALGRLSGDNGTEKSPLPTYNVLPGLQWHVNDNWWVSSGVLLPIGPTPTVPSRWQLTCSFQF